MRSWKNLCGLGLSRQTIQQVSSGLLYGMLIYHPVKLIFKHHIAGYSSWCITWSKKVYKLGRVVGAPVVRWALFVSDDQIQKFFGLKELKIQMSLRLFHSVHAGAIETLFDEQNQHLFKRAVLGKYLGIEDIKHNFKDFPPHYTRPRSDLEAGGRTHSLGRTKKSSWYLH